MQIDPKWLAKFYRPVPRYTSYPTGPQFYSIGSDKYLEKLSLFDKTEKLLSLYIHIPFCRTMCLFCGCSVLLNRKPERQEAYFKHLLQEIEQTAKIFSKKRKISQLHLGGGTPTSLTNAQFDLLFGLLHTHFTFIPGAEISIEIDPRTVFEDGGGKLDHLYRLGFNRVSFGVQDLDQEVQEAIKRRQTEEMTLVTYERARKIGFQGINIDLIYGLPKQSALSFVKTTEKLIAWGPDRIAFYSYAKIPWLKPHQKAIPEETLPSREEKFLIYCVAREQFLANGYVGIGMDHFAKESDSLTKSYFNKKLTRNFQGYSPLLADDMLGFGLTSIGFLENGYFQNEKELLNYETKIALGSCPVAKGYLLTQEDLRRRFVIQTLMCHFELDKRQFESRFLLDFDRHFAFARGALTQLKEEGLLEETADKLLPTPMGRLFIRLIASAFDAYLDKGKFSKAI